MIEVEGLSKSFNGNLVLNNISTTFDRGKVNLIIGISGSGKSVLTKCVVGLMDPDEGSVRYEGTEFIGLKKKQKSKYYQKIGMLFQGSALFDSMSVEENVGFPLKMFGNFSKGEIKDRVDFCLERVHIEGKNAMFPAEISGGMQKRVGIARAIVMQPEYLFCDEPNSGLDPSTSIVIDNLIQEITEELGMTSIVVTHDMNSVLEIGDKINFLHKGKLEWIGTKEEILHTDNESLNQIVFASQFMKMIKAKL
ncbi:MAG: phospholipid/cholesterol/gamma-HCH transport system ATP-binding protein [Sphingobacteriales bacterium]|jgi:phospholipid/cholesterol/gamma-HCH transport system ATP-binding protein